jgi:hypothetical protein
VGTLHSSKGTQKRTPLICELTNQRIAATMDSVVVASGEGVLQLDDNLKHLMKELGAAINDALSESDEISEAIQNVKNAGYDVFLVLEATIGFNRRSKADGEDGAAAGLKSGEMKLKVTAQDLKFLRSLKISIEDLDQNQTQ